MIGAVAVNRRRAAAASPYTFIGVQQVSGISNTTTGLTTPSLGASQAGDLIVVSTAYNDTATLPHSTNATGTFTKIAARGQASLVASNMYYTILTGGNAATTVTVKGTTSNDHEMTIIAALVRPASTIVYASDKADNAEFGSTTAFTIGPTTGSPPANSLFFYTGGAGAAQSGFVVSGWNTTGQYGFDSTMATNAQQLSKSSTNPYSNPCVLAYKVASSVQTPAMTLSAACSWFGVVASFH